MSPEEFLTAWTSNGDALVRFPNESLVGVQMSEEDRKFLTVAGLPDDAAPLVQFKYLGPGPIPSISNLYRLDTSFERYHYLGAEGAGDPICIDAESIGGIVCLEHDGGFRPYFCNGSVRQLGECLLVYREFMTKAIAVQDDQWHIEPEVGRELRLWIENAISQIDADSLKNDGFWQRSIGDECACW